MWLWLWPTTGSIRRMLVLLLLVVVVTCRWLLLWLSGWIPTIRIHLRWWLLLLLLLHHLHLLLLLHLLHASVLLHLLVLIGSRREARIHARVSRLHG
jgi:hypothetical protein